MKMAMIHAEALDAAKKAVAAEVKKWVDQFGSAEVAGACGFAWVNIYGVRKNSQDGKELIGLGFRKDDYEKAMSLWNPGGYNGQNIDVKEAGARAYANVFESYGYKAYASSRLD